MKETRVAITIDKQGDDVRVACFLTEDPQIDNGLRPYLERHGVGFYDYKPDVVGSQLFTTTPSPGRTTDEILSLIEAYYVSWGKEPSIKSIDDIIS